MIHRIMELNCGRYLYTIIYTLNACNQDIRPCKALEFNSWALKPSRKTYGTLLLSEFTIYTLPCQSNCISSLSKLSSIILIDIGELLFLGVLFGGRNKVKVKHPDISTSNDQLTHQHCNLYLRCSGEKPRAQTTLILVRQPCNKLLCINLSLCPT